MSFLEIARRWVIVMLAETLRISASAVEKVLPFQPRWLAQVSLLAAQLRAAADGNEDEAHEWDHETDDSKINGLPSIEALLASHTCLRQGLTDIVARGLALDDDLLQRMRTDWTMDSVVSYLSAAEKTLRDSASGTLDEAAKPLGMSFAAIAVLAGYDPAVAEPAQLLSKAAAKPTPAHAVVHSSESVR
jgi:hypothetical protein